MVNDKILYDLDDSFGKWWEHGFGAPKMTNNLYPYTKMFSPIVINHLKVKNRLVMGPMGNIDMAEETGRPSQKMISYFEERAKGGVGLITTGLIPVSFGIDPTVKELGDLSYFPRIDRSRTVFSGWREVAAGVHSHGANIFIQLTAGLGRVGNPQCLLTQFKLPVSASWNPNFYIPQIPSMRISGRKLNKLVKNFGQAAADAKAMNLDGVYLHGHEGYFLEQMTNPAFNRRSMGKYSDWQRFGIDVVKTIRERTGDRFPIMYRIDLSLMLNATYKEKMDSVKSLKKFRNERTVQQTLDYMVNLVRAGVDMFDVDLGCYDNWWLPHPPASMPSGCFLDIAELVKEYFVANKIKSNAGVEVPIVAVGKLGYPDLAEQALRDNKCDMIMLARPLLADPEWPNKAYRGECESIRPCIGCHEACIKEFVDGGHPQCAVNPRTAFEEVFSKEIPLAPKQKKVAVIGGGPAGVVAAKVLIARGHEVTLFESNHEIGGTLRAGGVPTIKYEINNYMHYLQHEVKELEKNPRFTLKLDTTATAESLKGRFDSIVVATGSHIVTPKIEGADNKNVVTVTEALLDPERVKQAKNIVIIGGGDSGCETAYWARIELGKNVQIVEMTANLMASSCTANRGHILHYLDNSGVITHNLSQVTRIEKDAVYIKKNVHPSVPNPYNSWQPILPENIHNPLAPKIGEKYENKLLPADLVILALGTRPSEQIYFDLVSSNAAPEIVRVGDAIRPGKVFSATKSAYRTARDI